MKRLSFDTLLAEAKQTEVKFFKGTKRAYCYVNGRQYLVGINTDINEPLYVVEGEIEGEKTFFLSNNEVPSEANLIGTYTAKIVDSQSVVKVKEPELAH